MPIDLEKYKNVTIIAAGNVAEESPDHICPVGTINDNNTSPGYVTDVENYCKQYMKKDKISYMDIGCAGGQLAVDFANRGHFSIGLEGSDHNIKRGLHNWPEYHKTVLHTADLTKPYHVEKDGQKVLFDVISAWEVIEHIHPTELETFFDNMFANLADDGVFIGSINTGPDERTLPDGSTIKLHQSVFPEPYWREHLLYQYNVVPYPFDHVVRTMAHYFLVMIKKSSK